MTTKDTDFETGYLFNNAVVDPAKINKYLKWLVNDVIKEEFAVGDYNQASNGNVSQLGRIYVNEDDAKACITKAGDASAYFILQIPKESVSSRFADPLDDKIEYLNVKEDVVPEVIGLSTSFGKYQITPQFDCVEVAHDGMDIHNPMVTDNDCLEIVSANRSAKL